MTATQSRQPDDTPLNDAPSWAKFYIRGNTNVHVPFRNNTVTYMFISPRLSSLQLKYPHVRGNTSFHAAGRYVQPTNVHSLHQGLLPPTLLRVYTYCTQHRSKFARALFVGLGFGMMAGVVEEFSTVEEGQTFLDIQSMKAAAILELLRDGKSLRCGTESSRQKRYHCCIPGTWILRAIKQDCHEWKTSATCKQHVN